jgi:hypothetical protein
MEIWKPVEGWNGLYFVSSLGRVRSADRYATNMFGTQSLYRGRMMKLSKDSDGYLCLNLAYEGRLWPYKVHRLVAKHFLKEPELPEVNHKDFDKTNNNWRNLEWSTKQGNQSHANKGNRSCAIVNPGRAKKLTRAQARDIRRSVVTLRKSKRSVAQAFGVSARLVTEIASNRIWIGA